MPNVLKALKKFIKGLRKKSVRTFVSGSSLITYTDSSSGWSSGNIELVSMNPSQAKKEDTRIEKKPVEVFKEIIGELPKINLAGLDSQIKLVKKRISMLKELGMGYMGDESVALSYLEARKKFDKNKALFPWAVTNDTLIQQLCSKYKVKLVDFTLYYRNVPMEAIDELEKFMKAWEIINGDEVKPTFKLIIDEGGKETKKDPILLAPSPFGKWWYILGAWDKEVEIVDDLIYHGK